MRKGPIPYLPEGDQRTTGDIRKKGRRVWKKKILLGWEKKG